MSRPGQNGSPAHAAENMALEMDYKDRLDEYRRERTAKIQECQKTLRRHKLEMQQKIAEIKADIDKRILLVKHNIDMMKDQRAMIRHQMQSVEEANNDFNAGELMRLTSDIDAKRHQLIELDEERQTRIIELKNAYEKERGIMQNHIATLNENYRTKAKTLRSELMAAYKENREKAEQQRQKGGEV
jgi:hypothetical protein